MSVFLLSAFFFVRLSLGVVLCLLAPLRRWHDCGDTMSNIVDITNDQIDDLLLAFGARMYDACDSEDPFGFVSVSFDFIDDVQRPKSPRRDDVM